jgi:hypothetical protein
MPPDAGRVSYAEVNETGQEHADRQGEKQSIGNRQSACPLTKSTDPDQTTSKVRRNSPSLGQVHDDERNENET